MSMLTPSSRRRRRRRSPRLLAVLVVLLAAAAVYLFLFRDTGSTTQAVPCPTPSAVPTAARAVVPAAVSVRVLNSTKIPNAAHQTAALLAQRGFTITQIGNAADSAPVRVPAQLRFGPAGAAGAKLLAGQLRNIQLVPDGRTDASVDLVIGTGFSRLRTPAEVAAAAASPTPTAAPSPAPTPPRGCRAS